MGLALLVGAGVLALFCIAIVYLAGSKPTPPRMTQKQLEDFRRRNERQ